MKYIKFCLVILGVLVLNASAAFAGFHEKSAPGFFVNGWPAFTVSYPEHWLEKTPMPGQVFFAETPEGPPELRIGLAPNIDAPLKYAARVLMPAIARLGRDIKILYDKETLLMDDTPAQEMEIEWELNAGTKLYSLFLTTKKEDIWIVISLSDTKGRIGGDLKKIAYSLKIRPGKEEPVNVPGDIQAFLDQFSKDIVSHQFEKVMLHYSDGFLNNGIRKEGVGGFINSVIMSVASFQVNITRFESQGNRAHISGYALVNQNLKQPLPDMWLIKENGQWKWNGNQK